MKLLIGTKNPGKAREFSEFLGASFECVSLKDFPGAPDVEENGTTFEENAWLKAKAYYEFTKMPVVTDDGGLEIDILNGEPGVLSRRWPGYEATDQELIALTLEKLKGIPPADRGAQLRIALVFYDGVRTVTASGVIRGEITEEAGSFEAGYPFRAIFWVPQFQKLYSALSHEEHDMINHRKKACEELAMKVLSQTF